MLAVLVFLACFAVGVPIAFILGATGLTHILLINPSMIATVPQKLFTSLYSFNLLAIPLFMLAGELMALSGDVARMCNFARCLLGHIKGGLAHALVLVGSIMGISIGSASGSASLLGSVLYPELKKDGYNDTFSASLIASTAVIGPILPPGIYFVIFGVTAGVSIQNLFLSGIMPGIIITLALFAVVWWCGRKAEWPVHPKATGSDILYSLKESAFALLTPVLTLAFIMTGICTPTEGAAVLCILVYFFGAVVYKKIKLRDVVPILVKTGAVAGTVMMIAPMGGIMGFGLAMDQIPMKIANFLVSLSDNKYVILLLINVLLLIVVCLLDGLPAILILVPVLMPVIQTYDIDPVHFGFLMCYNLTIGLLTPPVGAVLYVTAGVTGVFANRMAKDIWPWVGMLVFLLLLFTYIPPLVMCGPWFLG